MNTAARVLLGFFVGLGAAATLIGIALIIAGLVMP